MMKRVEHDRLKPSSPFYAMLREFCHRSKNLYNHGNYLIRQSARGCVQAGTLYPAW